MAEVNSIETRANTIWKKLHWQYQWGMFVRALLVFAILFFVTATVFQLTALSYPFVASALVGLGGTAYWLHKHRIQFSTLAVVNYLNHRYNWLEFSAQLLPVRPEGVLLQLQRQRIAQLLVARQNEIRAWPDMRLLTVILIGVVVLYAAGRSWNLLKAVPASEKTVQSASLPQVPTSLSEKLPKIESLQLSLQPPAYTRQRQRNANEPSLEAPIHSQIRWQCQLSRPVDAFQVIWNGKDTTSVVTTGQNTYVWQTTLKASVFYQIRYGFRGNWLVSPVYTLHAIDDRQPVIMVQKPAPYTLVLYGQKPEVPVVLQLTDDYGLARARLVATVSRGSGESVKFREVALKFTANITGKRTAQLSKQLDFNSLQMEPGDELYFYAETWDQAIQPQKSRSDTYFVQWEDTTSQNTSVMAGMTLDNMPAYFRSQRQIIIDTEKLLAEKKKLPAQKFRERSNDLGVDQKVLRLRYGQFLGEEFETNIGGHEHHEQEEDEHDGHDQEDRQEKTLEQLPTHEHESTGSTVFGQVGGMLHDYEHRHDVEDVATFFDETMKAQLKAALAHMWQSEIRLRTMRPQEALPNEYKAFELIKSLQQKSRVYVERVGFKPPPLKPAEKRLTGDLNEIKGQARVWDAQAVEQAYPHLRRAVVVLEKFRTEPDKPLVVTEQQVLEKASNELATLILQQPGIRVQTLNDLRQVIAGNRLSTDVVRRMQRQLLALLPPTNQLPGTEWRTAEPELTNFINHLGRY